MAPHLPQFLGSKAPEPHIGAWPEGWLIILEHSKIIKASSISPCSFVLLQPGLMGLLSPAQTHSLFLIAHKSQPQNNPSFCLDLLKYLFSPPLLPTTPSPLWGWREELIDGIDW